MYKVSTDFISKTHRHMYQSVIKYSDALFKVNLKMWVTIGTQSQWVE